jgi:hypothetical protein
MDELTQTNIEPTREAYEGWLEHLEATHDPNYYAHMALFARFIAEDIEKYSSRYVANRLHLSPPKLSNLKQLIKALAGMEESGKLPPVRY